MATDAILRPAGPKARARRVIAGEKRTCIAGRGTSSTLAKRGRDPARLRVQRRVSSRRRSLGRPRSLVQLDGGAIALRLTSTGGEPMAIRLRPMTLRDAHPAPHFFRRRKTGT